MYTIPEPIKMSEYLKLAQLFERYALVLTLEKTHEWEARFNIGSDDAIQAITQAVLEGYNFASVIKEVYRGPYPSIALGGLNLALAHQCGLFGLMYVFDLKASALDAHFAHLDRLASKLGSTVSHGYSIELRWVKGRAVWKYWLAPLARTRTMQGTFEDVLAKMGEDLRDP